MYEEIKDTLIEIAMTGIKSIIESDRKRETKYNNIRFIIEGMEDVLNEIYKLTDRDRKNEKLKISKEIL